MKIRMLVSMSGAGFTVDVGEETDRFSDKEAARMIEAGYAVPVRGEPVERAVRHPLDHDGDGRKGGSLPKKRGRKG